MFIPNTRVRLLNNIDITIENDNTYSFGSLSSQLIFFSSRAKYSYDDLTYVRKERYIKVERNIEDLFDVSYLMFQNTNFGDKWFYAFITDMQYLNDETTKVFFEVDELQTWYFDIDIKDCLIEREHVEDDTIGLHRIDEGLTTGEYVIRATDTFSQLNAQSIVVASTYDPDSGGSTVIGEVYTGIFGGTAYFAFDRDLTGITELKLFLNATVVANKTTAVTSIFMMPTSMLPPYSNGDKITIASAITIDKSYVKNITDINGYVPKNKKLFIYPYNFLYVSNNNGSVAEFRYELSDTTTMEYYAVCNVSPNPVVTLVPKQYKGAFANFDEILRLADYPQCSWAVDSFTQYLASAVVGTPLSVASGMLGAGLAGSANPVTGGIAPAVQGLTDGVKALRQADHVRGAVSGGINTAIGIQTFGFYPKTITAEYAKIIDSHFDRYGYRVDELKTPNLTSRTYWNFIKMKEANIFGDVPNDSLKKIISIFKNGITFWHDSDVGNYNRINL